MAVTTDEQLIRAAVADYVEGWFDGDPDRIGRALHPQLVKRARGIEGDDPDVLETLSWHDMVNATSAGVGVAEDAPDRRIGVVIQYRTADLAAVTCLCHRYVDLLHPIKMPEGWRIVNAAWTLR